MTDYQRFCNAVHLWQAKLGLLDWEIHIEEAKLAKAFKDSYAVVTPMYNQRIALIRWNTANIKLYGTPESLALHEVLHIALAPVLGLTKEYKTDMCPAVDAEEHALIKRLMQALGSY